MNCPKCKVPPANVLLYGSDDSDLEELAWECGKCHMVYQQFSTDRTHLYHFNAYTGELIAIYNVE